MLSCNHHTVAPCDRLPIWHTFYDTKGFVAEEVIENLLLPVQRDVSWGVADLWCGRWVDVYLHRGSIHAW